MWTKESLTIGLEPIFNQVGTGQITIDKENR